MKLSTHLCAGNERGGPRAAGAESRIPHAGASSAATILADDVILYAGATSPKATRRSAALQPSSLVGFRGAADTEERASGRSASTSEAGHVGAAHLGTGLRRTRRYVTDRWPFISGTLSKA